VTIPVTLVAVFALVASIVRFRTWYRMRKLAITPIANLSGGMAMVRGRVVSGTFNLKSPLTGKQCAYFHLQVRDRAPRANLIVHQRCSWLPIYIEDNTGRARLELRGARLDFKPNVVYSAGFLAKGLPRGVKGYLQQVGVPERFWRLQRDLGCRETHILPGEYVYVLGYCARFGEQLFFYRSRSCPYIITRRREVILPSSPVPGWFISASVGIYLLLFAVLMYLN